MSLPLISIITPSFNRAHMIGDAIQSVLDQAYPAVEHIIVDGTSTDGTLDVLRQYPHLRVVSEPDNGMYDAINKGIRMAQGEIIGLLNTDDLYAPGAFEAVAQAFADHPEALAVSGGTETVENTANGPKIVHSAGAIEADELWYRLIQGHPGTNAWFFKKTLFSEAGFFDTTYRYASDRYFLVRVALDAGVRPVPVRKVLYRYIQHSGSVTMTTLDSREAGYGRLRVIFLWEDIAALETFLGRDSLPAEVRKRMIREHGERCYRLAMTAGWHRQWKNMLAAIVHGFSRNLLWPLIFADMAVARIRKEFHKT